MMAMLARASRPMDRWFIINRAIKRRASRRPNAAQFSPKGYYYNLVNLQWAFICAIPVYNGSRDPNANEYSLVCSQIAELCTSIKLPREMCTFDLDFVSRLLRVIPIWSPLEMGYICKMDAKFAREKLVSSVGDSPHEFLTVDSR